MPQYHVDGPLQRAYVRLGTLVQELMKFGLVGGFAFLVDLGLFNLLLHMTDKPLTSKTVSMVVATTISYAGNRHWTWRTRSRSGLRREYTLFLLLNGIGLLIALTCLAVSHYVLEFTSALADNVAANVVGLVLGTTFRFWSYRRFVFLLPPEPQVTVAADLSEDLLPPS